MASEVAGRQAGCEAGADAGEQVSIVPGDLRICTIGNVDAGKSTLVGCLTRNIADDGRGHARSTVFRHRHEGDSGRTSSVGMEIMGFNEERQVVAEHKAPRQRQWQMVHNEASKRIQLMDLAGHEKYLRTTIFGMTGLVPDYALVVVGANMGVSKMTREHVGIAAALRLPLMVAVTKVDIAPEDVFKKTMGQVVKMVKQARRRPLRIKTEAQVRTAARAARSGRVVPVFVISNVTGQGLNELRLFLRLLPPRMSGHSVAAGLIGRGAMDKAAVAAGEADGAAAAGGGAAAGGAADGAAEEEAAAATVGGEEGEEEEEETASGPGEVVIDSVFTVPGVGTVVAGTVLRGVIRSGTTMMLGPDTRGEFTSVTIRSIHVQYTPVEEARAGGSAAFAIRPKKAKGSGAANKRYWVKKGMALVDPSLRPAAVWSFDAEVFVLHHQTTMQVGYAPIMHVGVISQSARVHRIRSKKSGGDVEALRTGDRAVISAQFLYKPEYVGDGNMLLFREGRAKGVGRITRVYPAKRFVEPNDVPHGHGEAGVALPQDQAAAAR